MPLALMASHIQAKMQQKNFSIEKVFLRDKYARSINLSPRFVNSQLKRELIEGPDFKSFRNTMISS